MYEVTLLPIFHEINSSIWKAYFIEEWKVKKLITVSAEFVNSLWRGQYERSCERISCPCLKDLSELILNHFLYSKLNSKKSFFKIHVLIMFKNSLTSKKMPKSDFWGYFHWNYWLHALYQQIHFLDWNNMKNEIFKNEQVWRLNQDNDFLSLRA